MNDTVWPRMCWCVVKNLLPPHTHSALSSTRSQKKETKINNASAPLIEYRLRSVKSVRKMFDRMPKILGVTWPKPRPFWWKLFMHPVGIPYAKLRTEFEVSSSNSFQDILDRLPENLGVTWPRPRPFWGKLFVRPLGFPKTKLLTKFEVCVPSSFEDMFDRMPKL